MSFDKCTQLCNHYANQAISITPKRSPCASPGPFCLSPNLLSIFKFVCVFKTLPMGFGLRESGNILSHELDHVFGNKVFIQLHLHISPRKR